MNLALAIPLRPGTGRPGLAEIADCAEGGRRPDQRRLPPLPNGPSGTRKRGLLAARRRPGLNSRDAEPAEGDPRARPRPVRTRTSLRFSSRPTLNAMRGWTDEDGGLGVEVIAWSSIEEPKRRGL